MKKIRTDPIKKNVSVRVPGSKSFTHRLLIASALSDGVCRIENPLKLANLLLGKGWDDDRITQILRSNKTRTVKLSKPIPVILFYLTALPALDGEFHALKDIYNRDQAVLKKLNSAPIIIQNRQVKKVKLVIISKIYI